MGWPLSLFMALLTGGITMLVSGWLANLYSTWYNVASREGAAGFLMVGIALLGGLVGLGLGLTAARLFHSSGFWKVFGLFLTAEALLAGLVLLLLYLLADIPPKLAGEELQLQVEIRLPAGAPRPEGKPAFRLGSLIRSRQRAAQNGELLLEKARMEEGRWVVPANAFLFTSRGKRFIIAELNGAIIGAFVIPLPAHPRAEQENWSDWGPRPPAGKAPWPEDQPSYRFRVQRLSQWNQPEQGDPAVGQPAMGQPAMGQPAPDSEAP